MIFGPATYFGRYHQNKAGHSFYPVSVTSTVTPPGKYDVTLNPRKSCPSQVTMGNFLFD